MSVNNKTWDRPWEIEEIVDNAHQWSLAGDAGLLKYLEKFSNNLLSKAEETSDNLNNLMNNLDDASLKLDIAKNKFLSLQNTQFVESRVYEDDEIEQNLNGIDKEALNEQKDEINIQTLQAAVLRGISIMDHYYERVDVPASDSEEDSESTNFVLRPKDPYIERPLPYVIGSDEWHKKWHVGLEDTSSEGESDKLSDDNISDNDSDDDFVPNNKLMNNKDMPEVYNNEFSRRLNPPPANSTFNDKSENVFESSDSDDNHSYPSQPVISNGNFANQLSNQLSNMVQKEEEVEDVVNKRPIMKSSSNTNKYSISANMFDDEPPPLADDQVSKSKPGLFSGGQGLFDDDDNKSDDGLWSSNNVQRKEEAKETEEKPTTKKNSFQTKSRGLFDESDSEDDLFSTNKVKIESESSFLAQSQNTNVLFPSDEPPDLIKENPKKKPIGGISPFGNVNLFGGQDLEDILQNRKKDNDDATTKKDNLQIRPDDLTTKPRPLSRTKPEITQTKPEISQTKPDDSLKRLETLSTDPETRSIKPEISTTKPETLPSKLEPLTKQPQTSVTKEETISNQETVKSNDNYLSPLKEQNPIKSTSLFDGDVEDLFKDDFLTNVATKKFTSNLFDSDSDDEFYTKPKKMDKQSGSKVQSLFDNDKLSFLDDNKNDTDDLFNINTKNSEQEVITNERNTSPPPDLGANLINDKSNSNRSNQIFHVDLFSDTPPPLDDDWDVNVDNLEENAPYEYSTINTRSTLFDNEPPSLTFNENESGIVKDTSEYNDSSFLPHASSTKQPLSDNQEQFSKDYFLTRNSLNSATTFDNVPELVDKLFDSTTKIDITPSGVIDQLYSSEEQSNDISIPDDDGLKSYAVKDDTFKDETHKDDALQDYFVIDNALKVNSVKVDTLKGNVDKVDDVFKVEDVTNLRVKENTKTKKDLPGRLTHNLNINVNALLPGAYGASKSGNTNTSNEEADKNDSDRTKATASSEGIVQTLPCVTKDRVKVITKRRPSTRRGRQEQLRKMESDFKLTNDQTVESNLPKISASNQIETNEIIKKDDDDLFSNSVHRPLKSDLDKDQLFPIDNQTNNRYDTDKIANITNQLQSAITIENEIDRVSPPNFAKEHDDDDGDFLIDNKPNNTSLFDEIDKRPSTITRNKDHLSKSLFDDDDDDDLFSTNYYSSAVKSKARDLTIPIKVDVKSTTKDNSFDVNVNRSSVNNVKHDVINTSKAKSIFDDEDNSEDDENSLFSNNNESKKIKKKTNEDDVFNKNPLKSKSKSHKKSLFDDDDDSDDDIFGKSNTTSRREVKRLPKATTRIENKRVVVKSNNSVEPIDDPLNVFKQ